jgi:hypothetical protein
VTPFALALALAAAPLHEEEGVSIRDRSHHERPLMLSFFGAVMPEYAFGDVVYPIGYGGAVRFAVSLFPDGFISSINDSFELELGANAFYGGYYLVTPVVEVRWTFHFSERFSAYGKVGAGYNIMISALYPHTVYVSGAIGALVAITRHFYLRAEIGYPGLLLGIGIAF